MRLAISALLAAAGLGSCAPVPTQSARDPSVIIASSTRFDFEQFEGTWRMRQAFDADAAPDLLEFTDDPDAGYLAVLSQSGCADRTACGDDTHALTFTGPGRFRLSRDTKPIGEFWVLWVDADFRTAAIGTPDGSFGWIIDRAKTGGADRITAAREVMAFNGYDISNLKVTP